MPHGPIDIRQRSSKQVACTYKELRAHTSRFKKVRDRRPGSLDPNLHAFLDPHLIFPPRQDQTLTTCTVLPSHGEEV
jgi:hypothetical protein